MELDQSIIEDGLEYAQLLKGRYNRTEVVIELTLFVYTHPELQNIQDRVIKEYVNHMLEDL